MKESFVYMLECSDVTSNLEKRLDEHNSGKCSYSYAFQRRPVELVFHAKSTDINLAIEREKQIKKWYRAKKKALIGNTPHELPNLAKKKF